MDKVDVMHCLRVGTIVLINLVVPVWPGRVARGGPFHLTKWTSGWVDLLEPSRFPKRCANKFGGRFAVWSLVDISDQRSTDKLFGGFPF